MKTSIIEPLGTRSFSVTDKILQEDLVKRIEQLEKENAECKLAATESLRNCEAQYIAMLESVDANMTLVDSNLNILWANNRAKKIFGRHIIGKSCCEALYGMKEMCSKNNSSCLTQKAFKGCKSIKSQSIKLKVKDGNIKYFEGTAKVVSRDSDGKPSMVVKVYKDITERKIAEEELRANMRQMRKNLGGTIEAIARTVETKDAYTAGHQRRTTEIARAVAYEMGLDKEVIDGIRMAGVIHDLGKISVPAAILSKPGQINESELSLIKQHPQAGYEILKGIDFKRPVADIVLQHHERLNGSGYPYGLTDKEILLEAKIIGVADVIEAMASHRPYRPALGLDDAFEEITMNRGILYDPDVVDASIDLFTNKGYQLH
jgi:PAS domain S-box-containing protein/putative nucleotidyltransferase with HDIG domain